jgi:cytochrome c-type biogenesis protein CcmH/NrfG
MKGIALLKEVLEEDENNTEALYYLGVFSIQSGQFDKGIGRFVTILKLEPDNQEARLLLSRCLIGNSQPEEARIELDEIMQSGASKEIKEGANELIEEIKKS